MDKNRNRAVVPFKDVFAAIINWILSILAYIRLGRGTKQSNKNDDGRNSIGRTSEEEEINDNAKTAGTINAICQPNSGGISGKESSDVNLYFEEEKPNKGKENRNKKTEGEEKAADSNVEFHRQAHVDDEDSYFHTESKAKIISSPIIRGIEGSNNSCYMDSSLNSMFLFSDAFHSVLEERMKELPSQSKQTPKKKKSKTKKLDEDLLNALLNKIARPLHETKIMKLHNSTMRDFRSLLARLNTKYLGNEMDPEEFISALFLNIFNTRGFYKIDGDSEGSYVFQTYADMMKPTTETTVQSLLEYSFADSDIQLESIPSPGFIIKMPVTDGRHMFSKIYPNGTIELKEILANNEGDQSSKMLLTAVICLESHHFTAFVRDGNEKNTTWWYLDSFSCSHAECFPDFDETLEKMKFSQTNERLAFLISQCYMCFYLPMGKVS